MEYLFRRTLRSVGRSGEAWVGHLKDSGGRVGGRAEHILKSKLFVATNGVTYEVPIIRGEELPDDARTASHVIEAGKHRGYPQPPLEIAPMLRELITDKEMEQMELWSIIVMHEAIILEGEVSPIQLAIFHENRMLMAAKRREKENWSRPFGFAFLAPVSSSNP